MATQPQDELQDETRQRLLQAAGEVFAELGYRAATTREICRRAAANVAAINYHFGDKEALYSIVLQEAVRSAAQKHPLDMGLGADPTPEQRLAAFIRAFLYRMMDEGRPAWQGKLLVRELAEPTAVLDVLVEQVMKPQFAALLSILRQLLGRDTPEEQLYQFGASIVGQCLFYRHAKPVIVRIYPRQKYAPKDIDTLAEHITRFSLAAIREHSAGSRS